MCRHSGRQGEIPFGLREGVRASCRALDGTPDHLIIPYTIGGYFAGTTLPAVTTDHTAFKDSTHAAREGIAKLMSINGTRTVDNFARELGRVMWDFCGMSRDEQGLKKALTLIQELRAEFWDNLLLPGLDQDYNKSLEKAGRLADSLEFAEIMIYDALNRTESCGGHFRDESQTEEGEAKRDDENFSHVSIWEYAGSDQKPNLHTEPLVFENVELSQRSYK